MKRWLNPLRAKQAVSSLNPGFSLRQWALGGAWLFIVVSLLHLVWVISVKSGDASGTTKLYHTIVGDVSYDGFGLTYTGWFGLMMAYLQFMAVGVGTVLTVLPARRFRRLGHKMLIAWAGLWLANFYWFAGHDGRVDSILQSVMMSGLFGCTVYRAWMSRRGSRTGPSPDARSLLEDEILAIHRAAAVTEAHVGQEPPPPLLGDVDAIPGETNSTPPRADRTAGIKRFAGEQWRQAKRGMAAASRATNRGVRNGVASVKKRLAQRKAASPEPTLIVEQAPPTGA